MLSVGGEEEEEEGWSFRCWFYNYFRSFLLFAISILAASYLSHCFQQSWNRTALVSIHQELSLLTKNFQAALDEHSQHMALVMKALSEGHHLGRQGGGRAVEEVEGGEEGGEKEGGEEGEEERVRRVVGEALAGWEADEGRQARAAQEAREAVQEAIALYDADKTGLADFARQSLGGCVISTRDTKPYKEAGRGLSVLGVQLISLGSDPKVIIQGAVVPGECWAFAGSRGRAAVRLAGGPVVVTAFTLEHLPTALSPTGQIPSAPNNFSLWGLSSLEDSRPHCLGRFSYDKNGLAWQTFQTLNPNNKSFRIVEVSVESNHGHENFTCLYRIRVHGRLQSTHEAFD